VSPWQIQRVWDALRSNRKILFATTELGAGYRQRLEEKMTTYKIVRFFSDERPKKVIQRGLTLEEAQKHCQDPKTRGTARKGSSSVLTVEWFDGYEKE
jgi:hypothetical protein